jgi:hypothetical protein
MMLEKAPTQRQASSGELPPTRDVQESPSALSPGGLEAQRGREARVNGFLPEDPDVESAKACDREWPSAMETSHDGMQSCEEEFGENSGACHHQRIFLSPIVCALAILDARLQNCHLQLALLPYPRGPRAN